MSYITGVNRTKVATDEPEFALGTIAQEYDGKKYKYVQYVGGAGSVAAVAGNVAFYYAVSGASAGQVNIVTSDATDSGGIGAGVLQAVIPSSGYGWVQISGPATLTTALTAGADGNALTAVGAGDGTLDVSALVTDAIVAYAVDASAKIIMCRFPE
jgi:hypothetical protein